MRESIIQTTINRFLYWLAKRSVTALYKRTRFLICSWGLDENTDLYLISEESYHDRHRFGLREEKYADTPQTDLVKDSDDLVKDLVKDIPQTDCEKCEHWKYIAHEWQCETEKCQKTPQTDCGWGEPNE